VIGSILTLILFAFGSARAAVVFETTTPHHHITVTDDRGLRTLSFNGSQETRMSLGDPLKGHFEYTEYFHLPWLWNTNLTNVLMIGLGGGSIQRSYLHYYPEVNVDTVELDAEVVDIAQRFFSLPKTPRHRLMVEDGRQYLRRSRKQYDAIILDAYRTTRYGSFIPYHMATKEFFEITRDRLSTNGVVAFNVIGSYQGFRADILGATYRTMKEVFPQVYLFPAKDSLNVVLVGTRSERMLTTQEARQLAGGLKSTRKVTLPTFAARVSALRTDAPRTAARSPILTDDFAPVDGLLTKAVD
jgi:spermidine synthase